LLAVAELADYSVRCRSARSQRRQLQSSPYSCWAALAACQFESAVETDCVEADRPNPARRLLADSVRRLVLRWALQPSSERREQARYARQTRSDISKPRAHLTALSASFRAALIRARHRADRTQRVVHLLHAGVVLHAFKPESKLTIYSGVIRVRDLCVAVSVSRVNQTGHRSRRCIQSTVGEHSLADPQRVFARLLNVALVVFVLCIRRLTESVCPRRAEVILSPRIAGPSVARLNILVCTDQRTSFVANLILGVRRVFNLLTAFLRERYGCVVWIVEVFVFDDSPRRHVPRNARRYLHLRHLSTSVYYTASGVGVSAVVDSDSGRFWASSASRSAPSSGFVSGFSGRLYTVQFSTVGT